MQHWDTCCLQACVQSPSTNSIFCNLIDLVNATCVDSFPPFHLCVETRTAWAIFFSCQLAAKSANCVRMLLLLTAMNASHALQHVRLT